MSWNKLDLNTKLIGAYIPIFKLDGEDFIWMNVYPVWFYKTSVGVLSDDSIINVVSVDQNYNGGQVKG